MNDSTPMKGLIEAARNLSEESDAHPWDQHVNLLHKAARSATKIADDSKASWAHKHASQLHNIAHDQTSASRSDKENWMSHYHNSMAKHHAAHAEGKHDEGDRHRSDANEHYKKFQRA